MNTWPGEHIVDKYTFASGISDYVGSTVFRSPRTIQISTTLKGGLIVQNVLANQHLEQQQLTNQS